jgi:hypothetical protein
LALVFSPDANQYLPVERAATFLQAFSEVLAQANALD